MLKLIGRDLKGLFAVIFCELKVLVTFLGSKILTTTSTDFLPTVSMVKVSFEPIATEIFLVREVNLSFTGTFVETG